MKQWPRESRRRTFKIIFESNKEYKVSIVVLIAGHTVCVCFFPFFSHIVLCNSAFGPRFCAIKSYHIISYHINIISHHITSHHIISYHIISYHIISYHIISYHIISYHMITVSNLLVQKTNWFFFLKWTASNLVGVHNNLTSSSSSNIMQQLGCKNIGNDNLCIDKFWKVIILAIWRVHNITWDTKEFDTMCII